MVDLLSVWILNFDRSTVCGNKSIFTVLTKQSHHTRSKCRKQWMHLPHLHAYKKTIYKYFVYMVFQSPGYCWEAGAGKITIFNAYKCCLWLSGKNNRGQRCSCSCLHSILNTVIIHTACWNKWSYLYPTGEHHQWFPCSSKLQLLRIYSITLTGMLFPRQSHNLVSAETHIINCSLLRRLSISLIYRVKMVSLVYW